MARLSPRDLYSLEEYHRVRADFRARVMEHKRLRQVALGRNATLYFEDRLTIQYQVQEMLRIERIFETEAIEDELAAYNPLIPDGSNLKATFMIEYEDVDERRQALAALVGIEDAIYVQVGALEPIFAVADEDLDRTEETKTSAVHFLRFELTADMIAALREGADLAFGSQHPAYKQHVLVDNATRASLLEDFS
jgi:hypothetical protein